MKERSGVNSSLAISLALLAILVVAVVAVNAQEEPTPVPEPAQEQPVNRSGDQKIVVKTTKKNPPMAITVTTQSLSGVSVTVSNG